MRIDHLAFVRELFREYADITVPLHGAVIADDKADGSSVTVADREASAHVRQRLIEYTPEYGVISEEERVSYLPDARWQWAVDPLDGTASVARGLPVWGLGMGLLDGPEPVAGYLHFPLVNQTFTFENGEALLNGGPVPPVPAHLAPDTLNVMITAIHEFVDVRRIVGYRLHNLGTVCYHLMMLAAGRCDAVITGPCYIWDLAPALPFTRARGYVERYLDGTTFEVAPLLRPSYGFPVRQPMLVGPEDVVEKLIAALR
jgi:fructose-1,6-bisphosphatase/inositol monophosphatase family enzyme